MRLPVIQTPGPAGLPTELPTGSLRSDGRRNWVHPADVAGPWTRARYVVFYALIALWAALPWISIRGRPAVFLDVPGRRFFLFGATFNAQDIWMLFFVLTGVGFGLAYLTALLGRVWCGWACPQTVFLEGVFRRIERLIEGPRPKRIARDSQPWNADKVVRKVVKHVLFVISSALVAHIFVSYFVSMPVLWTMMRTHPSAHLEAFTWAFSLTAIFYFNFALFREQLCLALCPYGRLQSLLVDEHTLTVGYDERRGEPRRQQGDKVHRGLAEQGEGDCIDCRRCVTVCPTGIDIRNGLQIDCLGCTACIDACDAVMEKMKRPRGLIRYDSQRGFAGEVSKIWRPRVWLYTGLLVLGGIVATISISRRVDFEANILRLPGDPFLVVGSEVRNSFQIHLVNKRAEPSTFVVEPVAQPGVGFILARREVTVGPMSGIEVPLFVTAPVAGHDRNFPFQVMVRRADHSAEREVTGTILGPFY